MAHTRTLTFMPARLLACLTLPALLLGCGKPTADARLTLEGSGAPVSDMAFSPDSKTLAVCYDTDTQTPFYTPASGRWGKDNLRLFDVSTGTLLQTRTLQDSGPGSPSEIAFSPDSRQIAGAAPFGMDILTLAGTAPAVTTPGDPYREQNGTMTVSWSQRNPQCPTFLPDGTLVAYGVPVQSWGNGRFCRTVWSAATGRLLQEQTLSVGLNTEIDSIFSVACGTQIAVRFSRFRHLSNKEIQMLSSGEIALYDAATGRPLRHLPAQGDTGMGSQSAFSPNMRFFATEDSSGRCIVYDAATDAPARMMTGLRSKTPAQYTSQYYMMHTDNLSVLAFSPDNHWLAAGRQDGKVKLYSLATGLPVRVWQAGKVPLKEVLFPPDGHFLAAADNAGEVHLWKMAAP